MMPTNSRRLLLVASLASASLGLGCHHSTGPRPTLDVVIAVVPPVATSTEVVSGVTKFNCDVHLSATATGSGEATWVGGTVYFFAGSNETNVIDSSAVSQAQLASTWGSASIGGGDQRFTTYRLTGSVPFGGGVVQFRYQQSGGRATRTARVPVHCTA